MQDAKTLQERIDALDWYYAEHFDKVPSANVKVYKHVKDVDEVAKSMPSSPFKAQAVETVKDMEKGDFSFFWDACEAEGRYVMECLFDGVAWNKDEPEWRHVRELQPYKDRSGFYGRSGGHFCIGITYDKIDDMLRDVESDGGRYTLEDVERLLDAIEWGLKIAKEQSENVPYTAENMIQESITEEIWRLEEDKKERATPRYKIDRLREWEKTLTDKERDAIARSIKSIEKQLSTLSGN